MTPQRLLTFLLSLLISISLLPSATAAPKGKASASELDSIVAVVEDDVILRSELDREMVKTARQLQAQGVSVPPRSALERQVLERLILSRLQQQAAQQAGIVINDEALDEAVAGIAKRNNLSVAQLREALNRGGLSYDQYREEVRRQMTVARLRGKEVMERIRVSDQEVDAYLARNPGGVERRTAVHLLHILAATPEGATPEQIAEARAKADRIVAKLRGGADFRQVARAESDARQALEGGDLGWLPVAQVPSVFADRVATMKRGEISEPLRNANGFHVVKLEDVKTAAGAAPVEKQAATQTRARHILIRVGESASDAEAQNRVEALRQRIEGGEDFAILARANSDDRGSAVRGGDLGWVKPGSMVPQFEEEMGRLQPGQISKPFRTTFGWHIVQVTERRQVDGASEQARQQAMQSIRERKAEEGMELFLRRLRDESYVEIRLAAPET
ncbi:MAG: peptidylprolyl isomerase [Gammaproteobacteria bacterium]|jgi:peptidyl-prolyl cis-trans isomerase SurA|nr:peptidylprolyl isomerase [Gammaproteobacteria bacterium]